MIATTMMSKMSNESWAPVPTSADRSTKLLGTLNTSPWTSFHPDSSLTSLSCRHHMDTNNALPNC